MPVGPNASCHPLRWPHQAEREAQQADMEKQDQKFCKFQKFLRMNYSQDRRFSERENQREWESYNPSLVAACHEHLKKLEYQSPESMLSMTRFYSTYYSSPSGVVGLHGDLLHVSAWQHIKTAQSVAR